MTEFKKFRVGDLFEDSLFESVPQAKSQSDILSDVSGIPYVVQSLSNNMVSRHVNVASLKRNDSKIYSGKRIAMGVTTSAFSYQPNAFSGSQLITLNLKDYSEQVGLYLLTCFQKYSFEFSYNNKPGLSKYKDLIFDLPVTADGSPDWQEMESVVDTVEQQHVDTVDKTLSAAGFSSFEDTLLTSEEESLLKEWLLAQTKSERSASAPVPSALRLKLFKISELFEVHLSNGDNKLSTLSIGDIPLVSSGASNNGVVGYVKSSTQIFPKNSITVDMFGNAFFQPDEFYTVSHGRVNVLQLKYGKYYSENVLLYLTTAIRKVTQTNVYGFSNMLSSNVVKSLGIVLPVRENGQIPDFEVISKLGYILKKLSVRDLRQSLDSTLVEYKNV